MRPAVRALAALAFGGLAAFAPAVRSSAQAFESIRSYDVQIEIRTDDSLRITETIVYDFGSAEHHGIYRDVPTSYRYDARYDRITPLHVESVTASPGTPTDYEVSSVSGGQT